jgi:hypothetical protein
MKHSHSLLRILVCLITISLLSVLPSLHEKFPNAKANPDSPTTIGTDVPNFGSINQRKSVRDASGVDFRFYSDGTNSVYKTSTDGITWSDKTTIRACVGGAHFSVWYDPTYNASRVYYVQADDTSGNVLLFCRGIISGTSITWGTWVDIFGVVSGYAFGNSVVVVCSTGRIMVCFNFRQIVFQDNYWYYATNPNNDGSGSWTSNNLAYYWGTAKYYGSLTSLTNGRAYASYHYGATGVVYGKLWTTVWGAEETISVFSDGTAASLAMEGIGLTNNGDDVYISFCQIDDYITKFYNFQIIFRKRTYGATPAWQTPEIVYDPAADQIDSGPVICFDSTLTKIVVAWQWGDSIEYNVKDGSWGTKQSWSDSSVFYGTLNCFWKAVGSKIAFQYLKGIPPNSPYTLRDNLIDLSPVGYALNLCVKDWDLTDAIANAKVTMNNGTNYIKYSNGNGWANYTGVSGSVTITVHYFSFLVNGTSFSVSADTTKNLRCKLYDVYVQVLPANQEGILYTANVTVFNSTSTTPNRIRTALSNQTGYAYLPNLPNNTLTFTVYAKSDYSLVIANITRTPTSDEQTLTAIVCNQNYGTVQINWQIIMVPAGISYFFKSLKKKRKNKRIYGRKMDEVFSRHP